MSEFKMYATHPEELLPEVEKYGPLWTYQSTWFHLVRLIDHFANQVAEMEADGVDTKTISDQALLLFGMVAQGFDNWFGVAQTRSEEISSGMQ